jgi:hypothetical protein
MYEPNNRLDKGALRLALKYNPFVGGRHDPESLGGLTEAQFDEAVEHGLLFRPNRLSLDHDATCDKLAKARDGRDERVEAKLFLASLSLNRPDFRIGLAALALARNFPRHEFTARPDGPYCAVCGMLKAGNDLDRNLCVGARFVAGGLTRATPAALAFHLECERELEPVEPSAEDLGLFSRLLEILATTPRDEPLKRSVMSRMKALAGFKSTTEQRQHLLETLGYCGILETKEHGGMLKRYVNVGLTPRKTHSSDWRYPVDFWTGKDGLNREALKFWFGQHQELKQFF